MHTILFKPEFATLIATRIKTCTTRPVPKRPLRVGDRVSLRRWTGKPYRSPQAVIATAEIKATRVVIITPGGDIILGGHSLQDDARQVLATKEGFLSAAEYVRWIRDAHQPPGDFCGVIYEWELI